MRPWVLRFHRMVGLVAAPFLCLVGLTGALLVWEEELDAALNPHLLLNQQPGNPKTPGELIVDIERFLASATSERTALNFLVFSPIPNRSGIAYVTGLEQGNQVLVDTVSGAVLGVRNTLAPDFADRAELIPWIYQFHYSLTADELGFQLLGVVALVWLLDSLLAWCLTLPRTFSWRSWTMSWKIARRRIGYDAHRAGGLWLTPVFILTAFSGVYFNLYYEVFVPVVNTFSSITQQPYEQDLVPSESTLDIGYEQALQIGRDTLEQMGVEIKALDYVSLNGRAGYYSTAFYTDRDLSRDTPSGHVYVNTDGSIRQVRIVGQGTFGDLLVDWQFPLHSGQAFGTVGRIVVFCAGLGLVVLSITGWWLFLRKRRSKGYI